MPLIVRWPGKVTTGRVDDDSILAAVDFYKTLLALAGGRADVAGDGEDVQDAWLGRVHSRQTPLFWEYGRDPQHYLLPQLAHNRSPEIAVREGRWKLLVNADGSGAELYDIPADPGETHNLAAEYGSRVEALSAKALDWRARLPGRDMLTGDQAGSRTLPRDRPDADRPHRSTRRFAGRAR
jgi:arylsulfatase A-like enzyme